MSDIIKTTQLQEPGSALVTLYELEYADNSFAYFYSGRAEFDGITLENINFTAPVKSQVAYSLIPLKWDSNTINFINFPGKTDNQLIIASKESFLNDVSLGENIKVEGKNNGIYQFSIYEIKEIESKDINNLMVNNQAKIIILNPTNRLGTKYLTALAK